MNKERKTLFKMIRLLLLVLFLAAVVAAALYPFENRSLLIQFVTDQGVYSEKLRNDEIAQTIQHSVCFEKAQRITIKEIRMYGEMKSMPVKIIGSGDVWNYVEMVENGEKRWYSEGTELTSQSDDIVLTMNLLYGELIQKVSASFLQERLMLMEICVILFSIGLIICSVAEERIYENRWYNHGPVFEVRKFCGDIKKYWQYMVYAAKTDLKAEVANSYLNRLWWLLEPFFNMIVYVVVFGNIMGKSVENYATFVFSALLMWNFFNKAVNYSVKLIRNNKDIVTKVYIPKFVLLLSNMILNIFKLLFSMIVLVVMMLIFRVQIGFNILWVIPAYIVMLMLAFGAGMIFLHFGVYVDDLSYAVGILMNMLMFLSGIFYDMMTTLPEPLNIIMMCLNPAAMFVDTMRQALLYNTAANLPLLGIWFALSLLLCCVGVHIVYKNENSYVKVV